MGNGNGEWEYGTHGKWEVGNWNGEWEPGIGNRE